MKTSMRTAFIFFKRLLSFALSLLLLSVAVFMIARLAPGDPLRSYYGERAEKMTMEERAQAEERLGLQAPLSVQYVRWFTNALKGDWGLSYKYKMPVWEVIYGRMGNTLLLGGAGFVLLVLFSLPLGVLCAFYEDRWVDKLLCRLGTVLSCIPEFWLSLALILIFAVGLKLFPSSQAYDIGQSGNIANRLWHLVLPLSVTLLGHFGSLAYLVRNRLLEELRADYVLPARAKGMRRIRVLFTHCLRNILPAYLSFAALSLPHILGGTYIVETVFSYPGLGALAYESALYKDYNLLMVLSLMTGALLLAGNAAAQALNRRIDPARSGKFSPEVAHGKR